MRSAGYGRSPPLPEIELGEVLPVVRQQVSNAVSEATERPRSDGPSGRLGMILHAYQYYEYAEV